MQELREKQYQRKETPYRQNNSILKPITNNIDCNREKFPKFITGYTGFVPTLNFRYGKSYSRAADDSITEFLKKQKENPPSAINPNKKLTPIRHKDDVKRILKEYETQKNRFKFNSKKISAEDPPIAGYTGHIPGVKGNEESLSQRYDTVVRRGLKLLREEREKRQKMRKVQEKITDYTCNRDL